MRRLLLTTLAILLMFMLVACGDSDPLNSDTPLNQANVVQDTDSSSINSDSEAVSESKSKFEQFEIGLSNKGIYFEKEPVAAEMVGASTGIRYTIGNGSAELYEFDPQSDACKTMQANEVLTLEGFGSFPVMVNNELALSLSEVDSNIESDILEIFNSLQ